jgi:hypothetical protein
MLRDQGLDKAHVGHVVFFSLVGVWFVWGFKVSVSGVCARGHQRSLVWHMDVTCSIINDGTCDMVH